MPELTISQVARQVGLQASTIRYYEEIGLLPRAQPMSGQRRYGASVKCCQEWGQFEQITARIEVLGARRMTPWRGLQLEGLHYAQTGVIRQE